MLMGVEILGVDSGGDAEREANNEMCDIVLADTTQTTPLGSRTFRFLYAPTLRQRSQDHAEHSSRPRRSYFLQDSHNSFSYCGLTAMRTGFCARVAALCTRVEVTLARIVAWSLNRNLEEFPGNQKGIGRPVDRCVLT